MGFLCEPGGVRPDAPPGALQQLRATSKSVYWVYFDAAVQRSLKGVRTPARPHLGTAGVAPDVKGRLSTIPPGLHGGNIDNWRIGAGSVVFYPVQIDGGMFSVGDPHISQGDRELSGTAIEAS